MPNQRAVEFTKKLFNKYARSRGFEEEKEAYVEELERWHLREEQWRAALDKILRDRPDYFPTLGIVLEYLRAQQSTGMVRGGGGWMIFELGGGSAKSPQDSNGRNPTSPRRSNQCSHSCRQPR